MYSTYIMCAGVWIRSPHVELNRKPRHASFSPRLPGIYMYMYVCIHVNYLIVSSFTQESLSLNLFSLAPQGSDYIHANFVSSYKHHKAFILTQGACHSQKDTLCVAVG